MEHYFEMRFLFPQLPGEIWLMIQWEILLLVMEEKMEACLPSVRDFDMFDELYDADGDWVDHQHTTLTGSSLPYGRDKFPVIYYHHMFRTDCDVHLDDYVTWADPDYNDVDTGGRLTSFLYYRMQFFCLVKLFGEEECLITYAMKHYEDGHVELYSVLFD